MALAISSIRHHQSTLTITIAITVGNQKQHHDGHRETPTPSMGRL